jgi:hypothetical protein
MQQKSPGQISKMRSDYREYLAANILSEDRAVSFITPRIPKIIVLIIGQVMYRLLSRALKVHVNTAKEYVGTNEQGFVPSLRSKDAI